MARLTSRFERLARLLASSHSHRLAAGFLLRVKSRRRTLRDCLKPTRHSLAERICATSLPLLHGERLTGWAWET